MNTDILLGHGQNRNFSDLGAIFKVIGGLRMLENTFSLP